MLEAKIEISDFFYETSGRQWVFDNTFDTETVMKSNLKKVMYGINIHHPFRV
jgi:hypothetical protein